MNENKLVESVDYYFENGLMVFTRKYHLDRGNCCGNGCKNCPYNYENVPEPQRSKLLSKHNKNQK
jgi:2-iminoacetate synthase ThiH